MRVIVWVVGLCVWVKGSVRVIVLVLWVAWVIVWTARVKWVI